MDRRALLRGACVGVLALTAGCARVAPLQDVQDAAFIGTAPLGRRAEQIKRAGAGLSWIMEEQRPGLMRATLNLRTHQAVVDIPYDESRFSIRYVSSKDLDYRLDGLAPGYRGTVIHSNYVGWIQNLERRIMAESSV